LSLRLLIYDRTCVSGLAGLSRAWSVGAALYRGLGRLDGVRGVASWSEALTWLVEQKSPIGEIQYWGHGKWGCALIDRDVLDARALVPAHPLNGVMRALRERLAPDALVWFRTCETFGAARGIAFAEELATFLGARVAGHTFVIGFHQSGLHGLGPCGRADWSPEEGLAEGTPADPKRARWSTPLAPHTVTCLSGEVPAAWFAPGSN
jgi:hypothetical protein